VSTYLIRRLLGLIPLLFGISFVSFIFMQLMPGGPITMLARNSRMTPQQLAAIKHNMGLDQPWYVQYVKWLWSLLHGNFGVSYIQFRPVSQVIAERIPNTVQLVVAGLVIAFIIALLAGVLSAVWQYSFFDHAVNTVSFFGLAMPVFWFGLMLQLLFAVQLGWLPSADIGSGGLVDYLRHLALPAFTLAFGTVAGWSRYVRSSMLEVVHQDYIRTAKAKGVRKARLILRHALKNALIPFITVVMLDTPLYLTGAVVTETIFDWPGMGRLFFDSLNSRDYPVLMGLLVFGAVIIVVFQVVADVLYGFLDPRIRYS
jgi:peptide/nickel transport system permease protein